MFEKIVSYLSRQLDIPAEDISRDTTFESLHLDSLDTVEMIMDLELEDKLNTVGELVDYIEAKLD